MLSTLRDFANRHRKKLIGLAIVTGGAAFALRYAQRRLREWEEREAKSFVENAKKTQHFENVQTTCNQTIASLSSRVDESATSALATERVLDELRNGAAENRTKLWEDLKVIAFARVSSLIYCHSLLTIALRIQLNVIGGYLYRDLNRTDPFVDGELQKRYLSLCHYFITEGIGKLCESIETKVRSVIEPVSLKRKLRLKDIEQLFWSIQAAICTDSLDPLGRMISLFVEDDADERSCPKFKRLLNETTDLMESDEVRALSVSSVNRGYSLLSDQIAERMSVPDVNETAPNGEAGHASSDYSFTAINNIELPLIKLIPILNRLTASNSQDDETTNSDFSRIFIQQLIANDKLKLLGANIYEAFCN